MLLGANDEWFAFAYQVDEKEFSARLPAKELDFLVEHLEQAFPTQG